MSRWIEVESLIDRSISVLCGGGNEEMAVLVEDIDSAPSIDIVRCGECKYWHKNRKEGDGMNVFDVCYDFQADDFCSYGEGEGE